MKFSFLKLMGIAKRGVLTCFQSTPVEKLEERLDTSLIQGVLFLDRWIPTL